MARRVLDRLDLDGEARATVEFLVRRAPQDVARRVPARHRGSRDRPAVRRPGRRRGSPEDAVPHDARRRRGGQPRDADAVEGGAALAALRRHLQPPDAVLRRRGHRRASRRRSPTLARAAARRTCPPRRSSPFLEGLPRRYLQLFSPEAVYRHVRLARDLGPESVQAWLERKDAGLGADRPHAGPAVPLLEHLRRPVVVRHGHPARLCLHQAGRPRRRHVPLHRRGAVPRAEPGRRQPGRGRAQRRDRGPQGRRDAAATAARRARSGASFPASRRSSTATTSRRSATRSSRSSPRTRSGCSTA